MKPNKQLFILIVSTLLTISSASFAQGPHVVTLNVDTNELNNDNTDEAFSFKVEVGTKAENIDDPELAEFYDRLWKSEVKHAQVFVLLLKKEFSAELIDARLAELIALEARVVADLELRPALH